MTVAQRVEGLVLVTTSTWVHLEDPRPWVRQSGSTRVLIAAYVDWRLDDGRWEIRRVTVTSAVPLSDGVTPSIRTRDQELSRLEIPPFLSAFPEAAVPPAARVTITEGEAQ